MSTQEVSSIVGIISLVSLIIMQDKEGIIECVGNVELMHSAVASMRQGKVKSKLEKISNMWLELRMNLSSLIPIWEPAGDRRSERLSLQKVGSASWRCLLQVTDVSRI